jgi:hypothetical protein
MAANVAFLRRPCGNTRSQLAAASSSGAARTDHYGHTCCLTLGWTAGYPAAWPSAWCWGMGLLQSVRKTMFKIMVSFQG